jgi:hypothetical protein
MCELPQEAYKGWPMKNVIARPFSEARMLKQTSPTPPRDDAREETARELASRSPAVAAVLRRVAELKAPVQAAQAFIGAADKTTIKRCTNA